MKPFQESYKLFKDHFFRVAAGRIETNLLFDESREPFFPLLSLVSFSGSTPITWACPGNEPLRVDWLIGSAHQRACVVN
ncbi:hypothetical protein CR513_09106, partial [Mucuna pruriens]